MNKQFSRGFRNIQVIFKEPMNRKQCLLIQRIDGALLEHLFQKRLAKSGRQLINQARDPQIVIADNGPLRIKYLSYFQSYLSFLGLGIQIPQSTWGNMLNAAQSLAVVATQPWMWIPPGLCILITLISINLFGDGLRDALDPKTKVG